MFAAHLFVHGDLSGLVLWLAGAAPCGESRHDLLRQQRKRPAGIYANEGRDSKVFHNVVRRIGYYDPEDGSGLYRGGEYLAKKLPGSNVGEPGATAILISNGDLNGPGHPPLEVGRVSGIEVYENLISWTRKAAVSVWNEWPCLAMSPCRPLFTFFL